MTGQWQWEARDTKVSTVVASTALMESEFQSQMVLGKKELPRYCVLVVMRLSCWLWVRRWWGGGGTSLVLMMGYCTSPLQVLNITPSLPALFQRRPSEWVQHEIYTRTRSVVSVQHKLGSSSLDSLQLQNLSVFFWVYGSHTDEAYSSMGLTVTKALYALSFMALELIFRLCHRKPSVLLALFATLLMWLSQSISCCMVMPWYLALETESRVWLCSSYE